MPLSVRKAEITTVLCYSIKTYGAEWRRALTPQLDSPMLLPPLIGHERVKTRLAGAPPSGKLPQAPLLAGPPGGGKQRLGLWARAPSPCQGPGPPHEPGRFCRS